MCRLYYSTERIQLLLLRGLEKNVVFGLDLEQSPKVDHKGTFLVEGKLDQQKHGVMNVQDLFQEQDVVS